MHLEDWTAIGEDGKWLVAPKDARDLLMRIRGIALNELLKKVSWTTTGQPTPDPNRVTQVSTNEAVDQFLLYERLNYIVGLEIEQLLRQENNEAHHTMIAERAALGKIVLCVEAELNESVEEKTRLVERNEKLVEQNVSLKMAQRTHEAKEAETNAREQTLLLERANMLQRNLVLEEELERQHTAALAREDERIVEVMTLRAQLRSSTKGLKAAKQQVVELTDEVQTENNLLLALRDKIRTDKQAHGEEIDTLTKTKRRLEEEVETQRLLLINLKM
jgi:hypothetical protein